MVYKIQKTCSTKVVFTNILFAKSLAIKKQKCLVKRIQVVKKIDAIAIVLTDAMVINETIRICSCYKDTNGRKTKATALKRPFSALFLNFVQNHTNVQFYKCTI